MSLGRLCSKDLQTEYNKYDEDYVALFEWEVVDVALFYKVPATICLHMNGATSTAEKFNMLTDIRSLDRYECFPW